MIKFNELTHKYTLDGKELISVTQLMRKHNLAPNYSMVNEEILSAAARKGTLVHKEIETYIKTGEMGFSDELEQFINLSKDLNILSSEQILHNDLIAGTYDLLGEGFIGDVKCTSTTHKEAVSWQLSLYAYLLGDMTLKGYVFYLGNINKRYDIPLKTKEQIEELLECERQGIIYAPVQQELQQELLSDVYAKTIVIADIEKKLKEHKEQVEEFKERLLQEMIEKDIKQYKSDVITITRVDESERVTLDSKAIKTDMPDVYKKYAKTSKVSASVRIKLNEVS